MQRPAKYTGKISPEELDELFGYMMVHPDGVLIQRVSPVTKTKGGILVPEHVRNDRATGSPAGWVLQVHPVAKAELDERWKPVGRTIDIGDMVTFALAAPQPIGLIDDNGNPIQPGDDNIYASVEIIHWKDIKGHVPGARFKSN